MPPPSLSTTTTTRSMPRPTAPSSPLESWRKATSPMRSTVGRGAPGHGQPDGRGHDAVDAVGAPVGVDLHGARRLDVPLEVSDRHGGGHDQPAIGRQGRDHLPCDQRLGDARPRRPGPSRSPLARPARAACQRVAHAPPSTGSTSASSARPRVQQRLRSRAAARRPPCRAGRPTRRSPATTISAAPEAASHSPATRDASGRAEAHDHLRVEVERVAQQRVDGRDRDGHAPHVGLGRGEHGPPEGLAPPGRIAGPGPEPAPATISPRRPARSSTTSMVGVGGDRRRWAPGPRARRRSARAGGGRASPTSGSRKARLRWTGPGRDPVASA